MATASKPAFRLTISAKLLIVLLGLSIVLLAFSAYTAFNNMAVLGKYALQKQVELRDFAVGNSIAALQKQTEHHLLTLAKDQAAICNTFFGEIETEINTIVTSATYIWQRPEAFDRGIPAYLSVVERPPNRETDGGYELAPGITLAEVKPELERLGYLDMLFIGLQNNNPNLRYFYVATQAGSIRYAPWSDEPASGIDLRQRPWYLQAVARGKTTWAETYSDIITGELLMTCAAPFYNPQKKLVGVIGGDITLKALVERILSTQVGSGGFAFMINSSGEIIVSPHLTVNADGKRTQDAFFQTSNLLTSDVAEMKATALKMLEEDAGLARIMFKQKEMYLGYARIPRTGWSLGVVMPVEHVIAPAIAARDTISAESAKTGIAISTQQQHVRSLMSALFVVMIFVVAGLSYALSKRMTKPILALHNGVQTVGKGNLDYTIDVQTGDELEDLAAAFNQMTGDLKKYIRDLKATTAAKEKFETELEIGRQIQRSLLPQSLPQIDGWEIVGSFEPAREVAGDFYDVFALEESGMVFFVVADVCDKGVGPAMFAAVIRTLLRAFSENYSPIADPNAPDARLPLSRANDFIVLSQGETSMFATVFAGVLNPQTGQIRYVNCGHNPPYIVTQDHRIRAELKLTGPVLGPLPGVKYRVNEETLQPGETLFIYTDGLPEAHAADGSFFTEEHVEQMIVEPAASAAELMTRSLQRVRAHIGAAAQYDDITLVIIRRASLPQAQGASL